VDHDSDRPGQKARPNLQNNQSKKAGGMAQAVKHLPNKCKALSSNPSTTGKEGGRKKKKEKPNETRTLRPLPTPKTCTPYFTHQ
jgi:hypothetical protein